MQVVVWKDSLEWLSGFFMERAKVFRGNQYVNCRPDEG